MRVPTSSTALLALSLPALINAVSLSDMLPRAQNLPPNCDKIYDSQISGCGVSDFTSQSCSDTCVSALQAMVGPIKSACGGQGITGSNLVVAFLANVGPQQICPDADFGSSTSQQQQQSTPSPSPTSKPTTTAAPTSTEESTTLLVDDTSKSTPTSTRTRSPAFSGTSTAQTLAETSSGAAAASSTTENASSSKTAKAEAAQQTNNDRSGGGSPFDENEGNLHTVSGADSLSSTSVLVSLGIAFVVVVVLFR